MQMASLISPDGFGVSQEQHATGVERVMEQGQKALLQIGVQVDRAGCGS